MFDRWRNSHGFGVHSPFGYQLVERVVRPCRGYAYYAYDDIDRACSSSEHRIADKAKMLLRLFFVRGKCSCLITHTKRFSSP